MRESIRCAMAMAIAVASGLVFVSACNRPPTPPAGDASSPPAEAW